MTKTGGWAALAVILALGACSQEQRTPDPAATDAAEQTVAPSVPSQTQPVAIESEAASPTPTLAPTPAGTPARIPQPIRGRWGLVPADCTTDLAGAKGLLTIGAEQMKFYEAVAKLGPIKDVGDTHIRATFNYSGEGQAWKLDVVLRLDDGGKTLVKRDFGPEAMPGEFRYRRCG